MKNIPRCLFLFLFLMLIMAPLQSQNSHQEVLQKSMWGIQLHNTISYSGFSNALALSVIHESFMLYGGIRLLTSKVYLPESGPWGVQSGLQYLFLSSNRLKATAGIDYQLTLSRPYNPQDLPSGRMNQIHEVNLSYGILVRLWKQLWLGSNLGFGRYFEGYRDLSMNTTRNYDGYSSLIRIYFHYEW